MHSTLPHPAARRANEARRASEPWSADRWGRLIAGAATLACTLLALLHHPLWLLGTLFTAANLVFAALTGLCPVHAALRRLGAREREDLFHPGGAVREDALRRREP